MPTPVRPSLRPQRPAARPAPRPAGRPAPHPTARPPARSPQARSHPSQVSERYRPGLDGLRALAVLGVVAYHLGAPWARGGFLGVDVFFVLSGYLITGLVLDEAARTGSLRMGRFLLRRARRLVPALLSVLVATVAAVLVFFRDEAAALRGDVLAALVYGSNWWSVLVQRPYAESSGRPPPLLHLWSLGIEEQFYLVWPLLVLLTWRLGGRRRVALVAAAGAVTSAALMAWLAVAGRMPVPGDPARVYFGTDTHASGLLVGAALAALGAGRYGTVRAHRVLDVLGSASLLALLAAFGTVSFYSDALFRGGFLAISLLAAVVVLGAATAGTLLSRGLGLAPLRWLGTRSYGIYLWHWPLIALLRPGVELPVRGWAASGLLVALTLGAAEASYRWVEAPVRDGRAGAALRRLRLDVHLRRLRFAGPSLASVVALTLLVVVLAVGLVRAPTTTSRIPGLATVASGATTPQARSCSAALVGAGAAARPPCAGPAGTAPTSASAAAGANPSGTVPSQPALPTAPTPGAPPPTSAFGDSVLLGSAAALPTAFPQVGVDAQESRSAEHVAQAVTAAADAGTLGDVVVLSTGTNGPVAEDTLRAMLARLADRRLVVVLNDHVPRDWEARNNELLGQVVPQYPNAVLADWHGQAEANPTWLWSDRIHLRPEGATAFATWLATVVQASLLPR